MRISDWSSDVCSSDRDRAARARDGHAEHVVVVDHQLLQEQVADLLDGVRDGFRVDAALGDVRVEEGQRRGLVAVINLGRAVDPHRDWRDLDVVAFDEFLRQVAGRVDDESDAHGPYLVQGDGHHDTTAADRRAASPGAELTERGQRPGAGYARGRADRKSKRLNSSPHCESRMPHYP